MKIISQLYSRNYYVLDIDLSDRENLYTTVMVFRKSGSALDKVKGMEAASLIDTLNVLPKGSNIIAIFRGDQVLTRFSFEERNTLFAEIEEDDFYIQKRISEKGWVIQCACRRSFLDPILNVITGTKHFILDISLGPVAIPLLEGMVDAHRLTFGQMAFQFADHLLDGINESHSQVNSEKEREVIDLGGNQFAQQELTLLPALLGYLQEGPSELKLLREQNMQSKYFRFWRLGAVAALSFIFLMLIINFLINSHISRSLNSLRSTHSSQEYMINEIESLTNRINEYNNLTESGTGSPASTYSYFLDVVAGLRPSGVWFNRMEIHPLSKSLETDKPVLQQTELITLSGEAKDPVCLNSFMNRLKDLEWVKEIELKHYESRQDQPYASFVIEVLK